MVKDLCFEIIAACPNKCKFCSSNSCIDEKQMILFEDFKRVIDYFMDEGGIEELSLSGGEPFLHPDLFKMVEYSKSLGIRTVIFTSGVQKSKPLMKEDVDFLIYSMNEQLQEVEKYEPWNERLKNNVKRYYERFIFPEMFSPILKDDLFTLKKIGLDKIVFDYQAYESETDSFLMGRNSQKHCCLLDSLLNASIVGLETDVHFIPMKPNYKEIVDILEILEIARIKNISLLRFVPQGRGKENRDALMLNDNELEEFMQLVESYRDKYTGNIRVGIPLMGENTHLCNAGLERIDIKVDGTILPCPAFKEIDDETMKKFGIKKYNIFENLHEFKMFGGKRKYPLCRRIYK